MKTRILIVEDDELYGLSLEQKLKNYGEVTVSKEFERASKLLESKRYTVAFIDLNISSEGDGLKLVDKAHRHGVLPIVLSAMDDKDMIYQSYELGCKQYFHKSKFLEQVDEYVAPLLMGIEQANWEEIFSKDFVTQSEELRQSIMSVCKASKIKKRPLLLTGETGVGKSFLAKLIHKMRGGKEENFVHLNVSELNVNLLESTLFGHKKGAFTGADSDKEGLLKQANGGTLFLDEIGTMPLTVQKKLLKVIEEKEFFPLGSSKIQKSDFFLISATCDNIADLIEQSLFRLDLFFRIKGSEVEIPSLRERTEDISPMLDYFISHGSKRIILEDEAIEALRNYNWFGNTRELKHLVDQLTETGKGIIQLIDLPQYIIENTNPVLAKNKPHVRFYTKSVASYIQQNGLKKYMELIEKAAYRDFIERNDGHFTKTLEQLQISRCVCYRIQKSVLKDDSEFSL